MKVQCSNGIGRSQVIGSGIIVGVDVGYTTGGLPLKISGVMFLCFGRIVVDTLRGVEAKSIADSTVVGITGLGIHPLGIEVEREMIVEERRIEVLSSRVTLEI